MSKAKDIIDNIPFGDIFLGLLLVLGIGCAFGVPTYHIYTECKFDRRMHSMVGKRISLDDDTITLVQYNEWRDMFTLSNGVKIDYKVAEKQLLTP